MTVAGCRTTEEHQLAVSPTTADPDTPPALEKRPVPPASTTAHGQPAPCAAAGFSRWHREQQARSDTFGYCLSLVRPPQQQEIVSEGLLGLPRAS